MEVRLDPEGSQRNRQIQRRVQCLHQSGETTEDKVLEDVQTKLDALTHKDTLQKVGIMHPYPSEWDLIPFLETYRALNINKYHRKGSPNQHLYHFHSLNGNAMDNDALMTRLFIGSLKSCL